MDIAGRDTAPTPSPWDWLRQRLSLALGSIGVILVLIGVAFVAGLFDGFAPAFPSQPLPGARPLVGVLTLLTLAALLYSYQEDKFLAALWAITPRLPAMIAIWWLALYLPVSLAPTQALSAGLWLALLCWLLATVPLVGWVSTGARRGREYSELVTRLDQLEVRYAKIKALHPESVTTDNAVTRARALGLEEARRQLILVSRSIQYPISIASGETTSTRKASPFEWVSGATYTNCLRALHHAEEALIDAEPVSAVIGDALHDSLRMTRSTIDNDNAIRDALRAAVRELDPRLESLYFNSLRGRSDDPPVKRQTRLRPEDDAAARAVIREIRYAINDFRDGRIEALFRVRNRVFRTILVTGLVTDLLVGLAILMGVDRGQLGAAAAFFLVGAVVGMFNRLRLEVGPDQGVETDFGLFDARLLQTLILSGVAAVGGVFLAALAPLASTQAGQAPVAIDPAQIFDLAKNPLGFLVAAAFGLTPDAIIGRLRQQTDALKKDLSKSEPAVGDDRRAA
jgi:hypothetical protein